MSIPQARRSAARPESSPPQPRVGMWVAATFVLFLTRALLFSTWVSRGPEVKQLLHLNTVEMGMFTMLYPVGGLLAVNFSGTLVHRFGSRVVALVGYLIGGTALGLLAPALVAGNLWASCVLLAVLGAAVAIVDFLGNYEGTLADKASRRSVFSVIHGAFGIGMLSAAALTGVLDDAGISLAVQFPVLGALTFIASGIAALALPRHPKTVISDEDRARRRRESRSVWREKRSLLVALIGFTFVMAEMAASSWVPIALTDSGFSEANAAYALSLFWVVMTLGRLLGGLVVDAIGRSRTVLLAALITSAGIVVFMLDSVISMPYLGLILWGLGLSVGFPMSVSAMGDDPAMATARVNMIITIVYISTLCVGPALGAVGQVFGIFAAFAIPLVLLIVSAAISKVTRPAVPVPPTDG